MGDQQQRPHWHVTAATDDAKILDLLIDGQLGQLYIRVSTSQRPPEHVATLNRKTKSLDNLIDALIEAKDELDATAPPADPPANEEGARYVESPAPDDLVVDVGSAVENKFLVAAAPGENIAFMRLPAFISQADAIGLAAWILVLADPLNEKFPAVRAAIERT